MDTLEFRYKHHFGGTCLSLLASVQPVPLLCGIEIVWHSHVVYTTSFEAGAIVMEMWKRLLAVARP